ncbi:MAG: tRNA (adenosine(37)-N6)-threonylcarbamoyltransferase complex dimerization subunit type 1 TsaB [Betaproteobacteria bacterium]|nr:tRNA (adenosine(37)-N6)-threonylcarbamoyltransferase complex dimerization subunit type 1 TsaB [Betaproteobacteria bacterium]
MNLLAIETSTQWCSVALLLGEDIRIRETEAGQRHSELLLPMVDSLLKEAGIGVRELNGIAFGSGPGSFTGLRIACGVAQGMALGADLRLVPVCSLLALAEASGREKVLSCLDARMGELYVAAYRKEGEGWSEMIAPMLCKPAALPSLEGGGWFGAGSGFGIQGEALRTHYGPQLTGANADLIPHAREVARLSVRAFAAGEGLLPEHAAPLYVRDKVALKTNERARVP